MTTHVHTHDGLERIVRGTEALGHVIGAGAERLARHPALASVATALRSAARNAYRRMLAASEARALDEIERCDWRMAAEIRAARGHDTNQDAAGA